MLPLVVCPVPAAAAGCCMVICTSQLPEDIVEILNGARKGTKFFPLPHSLKGRKRWLLTGVWGPRVCKCACACVHVCREFEVNELALFHG